MNTIVATDIRTLKEKKLLGHCSRMSLTNNHTLVLWQGFMTRRKEITNTVGNVLYSVQVFDPAYYINFSPANEFDKWACVEVSNYEHIPKGVQTLIIPSGLYAVFLHKGAASTGPSTFRYIFNEWLPASGYTIDHRPQFEILGEKYKNNDPDSEEEIWIPIRKL